MGYVEWGVGRQRGADGGAEEGGGEEGGGRKEEEDDAEKEDEEKEEEQEEEDEDSDADDVSVFSDAGLDPPDAGQDPPPPVLPTETCCLRSQTLSAIQKRWSMSRSVRASRHRS